MYLMTAIDSRVFTPPPLHLDAAIFYSLPFRLLLIKVPNKNKMYYN